MSQPQLQQQPQQVFPVAKFVCNKWKDMKMLYKRALPTYGIDQYGRQIVFPAGNDECIEFKNSIFETNDPQKIAFIRNHPHFTGQDKKVITEAPPPDMYMEQLKQLMVQRGAKTILEAITTQNPLANTLQQQQTVS